MNNDHIAARRAMVEAKKALLEGRAEERALDGGEKAELRALKDDIEALDALEARSAREAHALRSNHLASAHAPAPEFDFRSAQSTIEVRDLSTGAAGLGAETIQTTVRSDFYTVLGSRSAIFESARKINTGLDISPLKLPVLASYGAADQERAEAGVITADDEAISEVEFGAYGYSAIQNVSVELVESSVIDIQSLVSQGLAQRLVDGYRGRLATGTGSGQPEGLTVGAGAGVTAAATSAVTMDELLELYHSIAPEVRDARVSAFFMNDSTWQSIRALKDADGRYLIGDPVDGVAGRIFGLPVILDQAMPSMATGTKPIVVGAPECFVIRHTDVNVARSDDALFSKAQVSWRAMMNLDAKVIDTAALKALTMA